MYSFIDLVLYDMNYQVLKELVFKNSNLHVFLIKTQQQDCTVSKLMIAVKKNVKFKV